MKSRLSLSICLLAIATAVFAEPSSSTIVIAPGKFYVGAFGGGGSSNNLNGSQLGTAFFLDVQGGPLAVNAFGQLNKQKPSFFGAQLGYQVQEVALNISSQWALGVAAELEGYVMDKHSFEGDLINNTSRLPEHDFAVSYPMKRTVFLANAVINVNRACLLVCPYIGFGIGNAIVKISDANSTQIDPFEEGINHYNAKSSDTDSVFAGQIKLGLGYDINEYISFFAEYRWLYLASMHVVFGSTVYPTHVATSSWQVDLNAQKYNLGSVGIKFNW